VTECLSDFVSLIIGLREVLALCSAPFRAVSGGEGVRHEWIEVWRVGGQEEKLGFGGADRGANGVMVGVEQLRTGITRHSPLRDIIKISVIRNGSPSRN